jgi:hypothetical protein
MENFISSVIDGIWKTLKPSWFIERTSEILYGFHLNNSNNITEHEIEQIFHYNFSEPQCTFFILWEMNFSNGDGFEPKHIELCEMSEWYAIIRPNDSSHIIFPPIFKWFEFNKKWQCRVYNAIPNMWDFWWGAFQLDRNIWKPVMYTDLLGKMVLKKCLKFADDSITKNRNSRDWKN